MKEISKVKAYVNNNLDSIIKEKEILQNLSHPFIANLYYSLHPECNSLPEIEQIDLLEDK